MKTHFYCILVLLAIPFCYSSCNKNEDTIPKKEIEKDSLSKEHFIIAGDINIDSFHVNNIDDIIVIKGDRIGTDSVYEFNDVLEIDLNQDGANDFELIYHMYYNQPFCEESNDPNTIVCCMPNAWATASVRGFTNISFASGILEGELCPIRLELGDTIDENLRWESYERNKIFSMAGINIPWNEIDDFGFMALRLINQEDTLYGWIELESCYTEDIKVGKYVIEK
jgi:hypothetical protein